ncbi:MAG TPA: alpha/beta hydrolase [Solirubrobacterales bacterium]|nr:alpha/beta hydrolase [Solirubrobacterales bacterium]
MAEWRERGRDAEFDGRRIHFFERDGDGPLLLFLHGFPSSSFDWRLLLDRSAGHAALAPDFLGFGLSEKPRDHEYTLHWQADMVEDFVGRRDSTTVFIVAHDMGTSVATELMARDLDGELSMELVGCLLLNGSMVQDAASPTLGQRLLRSAVGPLFSRLSSERFFRQQFGSIFSPDHPLSDEEAEDQWALICTGGGRTLAHKTIRYMEERFRHAERWHGALTNWPKPLGLAWGMLDPVATENVLDAVIELRPAAEVTRFEDLGHYPQIEDPQRVADVLRAALPA